MSSTNKWRELMKNDIMFRLKVKYQYDYSRDKKVTFSSLNKPFTNSLDYSFYGLQLRLAPLYVSLLPQIILVFGRFDCEVLRTIELNCLIKRKMGCSYKFSQVLIEVQQLIGL